MIRLLRTFCLVGLCFALLLTASAMAQARGQARSAGGAMVLCTGTGPVSVAVDESGTPIGPMHICPDCALGFFAALAPLWVLPQRSAALSRPAVAHESARFTQCSTLTPLARGPPLV